MEGILRIIWSYSFFRNSVFFFHAIEGAHKRIRRQGVGGAKTAAAGTFINDGAVPAFKTTEGDMLKFQPAVFQALPRIAQYPLAVKAALDRLP